MKYLLVICIIAFASCSNINLKQDENLDASTHEINLEVKKFTLDNGMRLIVYEDSRLPIVSYYTYFDVGGRYEQEGLTGATHFLEHMMFKGTTKFPQGQFDGILESHGGSTNAYTTFDSTVYYQSFPSSLVDKIIELESDRMTDILLESESFEKERNVVLEERKMRYENNPRGKLFLETMQAVFEGTPYGLSVIGEEGDVKALSIENLKKFHRDFYAPNNAILVIAGDVDADDVYQKVKRMYGKIPASEGIAELKKKMDDPSRFTFKSKMGVELNLHGTNPAPFFMLAYKGEQLGTKRALTMDMLSSIIGDGNSSYLSEKYVKNSRPVLANVYTSNYNLKNNGTFLIGGELLAKTNLKHFKKNLLKDLKKVCEKSIDERSLQKTKNQYLKYYYDAINTNDGIARFLGSNENVYGDYAYYKKELEIYNSLTTDDVKSVCFEILNNQNPIVVTIWNKNPIKK